MYQRTLDSLQSEGHLLGEFVLPRLAGTDAVHGMPRWEDDRGAELKLIDPGEAWRGHELGHIEDAYGRLADNTLVTLPDARIGGYAHSAMLVPTFRASTMLLGANVSPEDEWGRMIFRTAHLHEWHPITGISMPSYDYDDRGRATHVVVDWAPPESVSLNFQAPD